MSIMIKGMKMPDSCYDCRMRTDSDFCSAMPKEFCGYTDDIKRPDWCPLIEVPSAEPVKAYTKADYIMALHKEYGCTLTMAEEAHNKALEYLRSKARMKG